MHRVSLRGSTSYQRIREGTRKERKGKKEETEKRKLLVSSTLTIHMPYG
jgi:hypothetical protein